MPPFIFSPQLSSSSLQCPLVREGEEDARDAGGGEEEAQGRRAREIDRESPSSPNAPFLLLLLALHLALAMLYL